MEIYDFEYDGLILSDMGYIVCKFDSEGLQTISNGSQITFNTVPTLNGAKHELSNIEYSDCLKTTFQICKNPCHNNLEINIRDLRDLMSWLNRKEFHKLKFLNDEYLDLFFEASFNISRIEFGGKIYGLELEMITNRPFALRESQCITISNTSNNGKKTIYSISDEEGYIYPHMEITIKSTGTLDIFNDLDDRHMVISNCSNGERITLDYPIISTSLPSHEIQNDFNWNFFRIANTYKNNKNNLTISIPCDIKITYHPIIKVGI